MNPVFCAVARAAKQRAAIATNMLGEIDLIVKTVAALCTVGGLDRIGSALSKDCRSSGDRFLAAKRRGRW